MVIGALLLLALAGFLYWHNKTKLTPGASTPVAGFDLYEEIAAEEQKIEPFV